MPSQDSKQYWKIFRFPAIFMSRKSHGHLEEDFRGNHGRKAVVRVSVMVIWLGVYELG